MNQKFLLLALLLFSHSLFAKEQPLQLSEEALFLKAGYDTIHFQKAQKLNLNVRNYHILYRNNRLQNSSTLMLILGTALLAPGIYACVEDLSSDTPQDPTDESLWDIIIPMGYTTMIFWGSSLVTVGIINKVRIKSRKVYQKDGTELQLSLSPVVMPTERRYGAQLSLAF